MNGKCESPLVSVCIMAYNHEAYIEECLLSVLSQQIDFPIEIIVGEDCSTDRTRMIVERYVQNYPEVIIPVFREINIGAAQNYIDINRMARGRFIATLDGDDFWYSGKLQAQTEFLLKNEECSMVCTNAAVVDLKGSYMGGFCDCSREIIDLNYFVSGANFLPQSSYMYRSKYRSLLFSDLHKITIDYGILLVLLQCGNIGFINKCFVGYRAGVPGSMIAKSGEFVSNEIFRLLKEISTYADPHCFSRGIGVQKANRFLFLLRQGRVIQALKLLFVVLCGESWWLATKSMAEEVGRRIWQKMSRELLGGNGGHNIFHPAPR